MINNIKKFKVLSRLFSTVQVNYTPDKKNTESQVFNFTPDNEKKVLEVLKKYPANYKKSAVIPVLFIAQKQNDNFLSLGAMNKVAEILRVPYIEVYEVASFYTMFNRTKVGRFHLQICGTTPCLVRGADKIIHKLEEHLGIKMGQTTKDGLFTMTEVECLGACVNAPMLQINNEWVYEDLDEENVVQLVDDLKNGKEVKKGPQNKRINCLGPMGRTSLYNQEEMNKERVNRKRDFQKIKEEYEKKKAEAKKQQLNQKQNLKNLFIEIYSKWKNHQKVVIIFE